jgi:hypothetical protein
MIGITATSTKNVLGLIGPSNDLWAKGAFQKGSPAAVMPNGTKRANTAKFCIEAAYLRQANALTFTSKNGWRRKDTVDVASLNAKLQRFLAIDPIMKARKVTATGIGAFNDNPQVRHVDVVRFLTYVAGSLGA